METQQVWQISEAQKIYKWNNKILLYWKSQYNKRHANSFPETVISDQIYQKTNHRTMNEEFEKSITVQQQQQKNTGPAL